MCAAAQRRQSLVARRAAPGHTHTYKQTHTQRTHTHTHAHSHAHTHTHTHTLTQTHTHTHTHTHTSDGKVQLLEEHRLIEGCAQLYPYRLYQFELYPYQFYPYRFYQFGPDDSVIGPISFGLISYQPPSLLAQPSWLAQRR